MARGEETISTREAAATSVKFYSTWFCPYAHRVWIALEFKAVPYTWIECVLYERDPSTKVALPLDEKRRRTPGFVECCPRGLVPGIECGGTKMYESMVLLEFIDEAFSGPALLPPPSEPASRARVKLWVAFIAERVIPCYYRLLMAQGDEQRAKARQSLLDGLRTLSTEALVHPKGPFLMGDTFGLFEAALLPWWFRMVVLAAYRGWELPAASDEPTLHALHAWGDACAAHPACAATLVDRDRLIASNIGYADNTATSTCAQIMRAGADMGARAPAPAPAGGVEGVLFSRLSSNNSARVRAWLYARGLEARYELRQLSHERRRPSRPPTSRVHRAAAQPLARTPLALGTPDEPPSPAVGSQQPRCLLGATTGGYADSPSQHRRWPAWDLAGK